MRDRPNHQLWIATLFLLSLIACSRSKPPPSSESSPDPSPLAAKQGSRLVPRRTNPLVVINPVPSAEVPIIVTNTAPVVSCGAPQTLPCSSLDGTELVITAHVEDPDGDAVSVIWTIDGKERYTQQIAAGNAASSTDLTFSYTFTPGDHAIKVTALDGEFSAVCESTVTIQKDSQAPVIACPAYISVPIDPGQCSAIVVFNATATDNCPDVTVTSEPPSGTAFPIGTTTVVCTATDVAGNTAECTFAVTVGLSNRCPKNDAFWRQNPGAWPLTSLRIGNQVYSKSQVLPLLRATVSADASLVLARQLIVATLNTAHGSDPRPICNELAQANGTFSRFSGKLPYRVNVSSAAGRSMVALSSRLSGYNNGILTPNCGP